MSNMLIHGDCFSVLPTIPDQSIDMIITDPPYNTSECTWDTSINISSMFEEFNRIIKDRGVIAIFGIDLFSAKLMLENSKYYRYKWIWNKVFAGNFANAKIMPMKNYEEILIFYKNPPLYNPQMKKRESSRVKEHQHANYSYLNTINCTDSSLGLRKGTKPYLIDFNKFDPDNKYPQLILEGISQIRPNASEKVDHSTQKPVKLYEYLINTYTNPQMVICDPFAGTNTIAEACITTKRQWIAIEKEAKHIQIGINRLKKYYNYGITMQKIMKPYGIEYSVVQPFDQFIKK